MNVDSECHDAKISYSDMLHSNIISQSNKDVLADLISMESNFLMASLSEDLANMEKNEVDGVFDNECDVNSKQFSSTLTGR